MQHDNPVKLNITVFKKKLLTLTEVYAYQRVRRAEM